MGATNVDNMHIDGTHGIFPMPRACKGRMVQPRVQHMNLLCAHPHGIAMALLWPCHGTAMALALPSNCHGAAMALCGQSAKNNPNYFHNKLPREAIQLLALSYVEHGQDRVWPELAVILTE